MGPSLSLLHSSLLLQAADAAHKLKPKDKESVLVRTGSTIAGKYQYYRDSVWLQSVLHSCFPQGFLTFSTPVTQTHFLQPYAGEQSPQVLGERMERKGFLQFHNAAPLFQMLWGRLDIQANGTIRLRDEELASLRPARRFLQILEEEVPKTPAEIEQHLRYYSLTDTPLPPTEFDRLLFTSVYSAYQVRSVQGLDKTPWVGFFSQLVDEIFRDLCKGLCPANTTLLQASWPWKEKPSHLASLKHFYRSNLARTKRET
uniref:F180B protein n=2 Tax=Carduelinae TaxID=37599 RepID=A0A8C9MJ56_SERCA